MDKEEAVVTQYSVEIESGAPAWDARAPGKTERTKTHDEETATLFSDVGTD